MSININVQEQFHTAVEKKEGGKKSHFYGVPIMKEIHIYTNIYYAIIFTK